MKTTNRNAPRLSDAVLVAWAAKALQDKEIDSIDTLKKALDTEDIFTVNERFHVRAMHLITRETSPIVQYIEEFASEIPGNAGYFSMLVSDVDLSGSASMFVVHVLFDRSAERPSRKYMVNDMVSAWLHEMPAVEMAAGLAVSRALETDNMAFGMIVQSLTDIGKEKQE